MGIAPSYRAVDLPETDEHYVSGRSIVYSLGDRSQVALGPNNVAPDASERPVFKVYVENLGSAAVEFGPENVYLVTNSGKRLSAISAEQLQREAKRRATWAAIGAGLQATSNSLNAYNAGYESGTLTYSGTTNYYGTGGFGVANTYGTGTYSGYNAGAAAQAQAIADAQNRELMAVTQTQINSILANAQFGALQRQTVYPNQQLVSRVTFDKVPKDSTTVEAVVIVGDEEHRLKWEYSVD